MEIINKIQSIQTPIQLISSSYFLKLVTKILLPFSLLSVILSYHLLCDFHTLAYGLHLFSFIVGKNYMFLLCNGLLVFIASSSGLIGNFREATDFRAEKPLKSKGGSQGELQVESSSEPKGSILKAKVIAEVVQDLALVQGREDQPMFTEEGEGDELLPVEEDEDEGLGSMSKEDIEELNKKFDDFIRKMREGIQFEAW